MAYKSKVNMDEAVELHEQQNWNYSQLAEKYGVSPQAIAERFKKRREALHSEELEARPWPWKVAAEHARGSQMYAAMLALRKLVSDRPMTPEEQRNARGLLSFASKMNLVITYDRQQGFMWTTKLPVDGDEMFVVRP